MSAVIMRCAQLRKKPTTLSGCVSCFEIKAYASSGNAKPSIFPEIPPVRPEGEWGDMHPKICWLWDKRRRLISKYKSPRHKVKFLTEIKHKSWKFPPINHIPKSFEYQCGITKTNATVGTLPEVYDKVDIDGFEFERVKSGIVECLDLDHHMNRSKTEKRLYNKIGASENKTLMRVEYEMSRIKFQTLLTNLFGMLGNYQSVHSGIIDKDVEVGACFHRHGVKRQKTMKKPENPKFKHQNNAPFQGQHLVDFQLRKREPLTEFVSHDSMECQKEYPTMYSKYKPKYLGQFAEHVPRNITSGFNLDLPLDPFHFTHLSVVFSNNPGLQALEKKYGKDCREEALRGYGLVTGFLSTLAQAHVRGFNMYEELQYPITTQIMLTDGRKFQLCAYQLNTTQLWKCDEANKLCNLYWISEPYELYEGFEDGKVVGFDDESLRLLLKSLLIPNQATLAGKKPYLYPFPALIPRAEKVVVEKEEFVYDK